MSDWLKSIPSAASEYLSGHKLDEVECLIPDLSGIARGKAMPATKFATQEQFYLPNSIFFQTITGGWGEAAGDEGFTEPDMVLKPDFETATAAPWTADWTLQVIHDAFTKAGEP
ncbi:MAG: glutamine synthetase, partial [Boseongicola sp.]|nr:glutamine synthetase [Boseongicola sp.]